MASNISRIAQVVSSLGLSCIGLPLWDMCECQAEFGYIAKITEVTVSSLFFVVVKQKLLLLKKKYIGLPRAEKRKQGSIASSLCHRNK